MLYIHIPFCKQACHYCGFHFSTQMKYSTEMWQSIRKEISLTQGYLENNILTTIYFGGGTPSLLPMDELQRLFDVISNHYDLSRLQEVTLEANPDDLNADYLSQLKKTPINRLSIGIQSFQDEDLKLMNRAHNAEQADYAIKLAQDKGFTNLNCDLIFGTPTLTEEKLVENIMHLSKCHVPHISAYGLTIEPKTAFGNWVKRKVLIPKTTQEFARQMLVTMETLANQGYEQYEISNYAKNKMYAVHNTNYWTQKPYLGIGPSAHSYNLKSRRWNVRNNAQYIKSILNDNSLPYQMEELTTTNKINETMLTGLRTMWGVDLDKLRLDFGDENADVILQSALPYLKTKHLKFNENKLQLTKIGKLIGDRITSDLFIV